jgi:hypothetical protein
MDPEGLFPSFTGPITKKMNPANTVLSYFLKIDLNIASPSTIVLYSGVFLAVFPTKTILCIANFHAYSIYTNK